MKTLEISTFTNFKLREIRPQDFDNHFNLLVNRIYAMLAISDKSKLRNDELLVFKQLLKEKFPNISAQKILNAFSWALMQEELDVKRLDFKTLSRVISAHNKYLQGQRRNFQKPNNNRQKRIIHRLSESERKNLLEEYYREWKKGRDTAFFAVKTGCFDYLKQRYDIAKEIISRKEAFKKAKEKIKKQYADERKDLFKVKKIAQARKISLIIQEGMFQKEEFKTAVKQVVIEEYFKQLNYNRIKK